jgi:hypothetical protein
MRVSFLRHFLPHSGSRYLLFSFRARFLTLFPGPQSFPVEEVFEYPQEPSSISVDYRSDRLEGNYQVHILRQTNKVLRDPHSSFYRAHLHRYGRGLLFLYTQLNALSDLTTFSEVSQGIRWIVVLPYCSPYTIKCFG